MTGLSLNHTYHVLETVEIMRQLIQWLYSGKGFLGSSSQHSGAFVHLEALEEPTMSILSMESATKVPDLEAMICPLSTLIEQGVPEVPCMTWIATLLQPYTAGRVQLASTNPDQPPKFNFPLLTDERDLTRLRKVIHFVMRLADGFAASETGYPFTVPLKMAPGINVDYPDALIDKTKNKSDKAKLIRELLLQTDTWKTVANNEIDKCVQRTAAGSYDPSRTCRMSLSSQFYVVDQRQQVRGV